MRSAAVMMSGFSSIGLDSGIPESISKNHPSRAARPEIDTACGYTLEWVTATLERFGQYRSTQKDHFTLLK